MAQPSLSVVILAAGAGTRMKSELPKPLHQAAGRPMLAHVLDCARQLLPTDITIVASPTIRSHLSKASWAGHAQVVVQDPPRGTADAVRVALDGGAAGDLVIVLYADHPLVTSAMLQSLLESLEPDERQLAVLTCIVDDAAGYGRIERDEAGRVRAIVEKVDDHGVTRSGPTEINSGVMAMQREWVAKALAELRPNARKGEFFLTDLVGIAYEQDPTAVTTVGGTADVLVGVNDRAELAAAEALLFQRKREQLLEHGVTLIAPASNFIALDVEIGTDSIVGPGCVIEPETRIGMGCRIGPNAVLRSSTIGDRVRIESSTVEHSTIDSDADVGPYAHVRAGSHVGRRVHIGNYAELKNAAVGDDTRIGHFSYVGDAGLGSNVNVGAGTVTCNFDGVAKHHTEIGEDAFIGSDSLLVAPVTIGPGARTGAGAVVTKDVAAGATVVGMPARQIRRAPSPHSKDLEGGR